ncbi:MAG TPA: helicase HerA-like domain-containing protein, partial [Pseudomonas sp.]|nr:helicase HerA-like domain-containing protein [Pseudomonas sp.]
MAASNQLVLGAGVDGQAVTQSLRLANRHGLIAGATGTGKTVTLQRLIESFSDAGVAVFAADVKGDLCGLGAAGNPQGKVAERIASMPWLGHQSRAYPLSLWDVQGHSGHPLRTTLSEMGPLLLGALLELTDSQQAALYAAFKVADREGLLLLDLKDLKALLAHLKNSPEVLGEDSALFTATSSQALLRKLSSLEQQGADALFGEPALQLEDILHPDADGRGRIHLLDASLLVHEAPKVYATFLLWLLAELFEQLHERGDADKPLLALFFDEAHLLFADTPKALQERLEQVVRLIRSKGV